MDDLLVKHLLRETTPEETRTVEAWLAETPYNKHYYQQLQLIWEKSLRLTPGTLNESAGDEEQAWQTLRKRLNKPARPKPVIPLPWAVGLAAAAILLPLLLITFFGLPGTPVQQTLSANNKPVTDTLPDGTIVVLNTYSTLTREKKFNHRTVRLEGEAFFQVTTERSRPFQLSSNGVTITVLGTAFNVRTDSAATKINVETGRVKVANTHGAVELGAGESITLTASSRLQKHPSPGAFHNYYHPKVFVCNATPLEELTEALQEAYNTPILVGDSSLRRQPISVTFRDESLDRILSVLRQTLNITATTKGDTIILKTSHR